jgi:hypothetical protein
MVISEPLRVERLRFKNSIMELKKNGIVLQNKILVVDGTKVIIGKVFQLIMAGTLIWRDFQGLFLQP